MGHKLNLFYNYIHGTYASLETYLHFFYLPEDKEEWR